MGAGRIISLEEASADQQQQAARILVRGFAHTPTAWPDLATAEGEINTFLEEPQRMAYLAAEGNAVRGWIGAIRHTCLAWELHPLVVDSPFQRLGWGRRLVLHLEEVARGEGVVTIWLGADDDFGGTSLYGKNLYPDVLGHLRELHVTAGHPLSFYRQLGYVVTGVLPDVNGRGKHDIVMAKRLSS